MKRAVLAFFGTWVAGFVLYAVVNCFQPIPSPRLFGEAIGFLSVLFAIAAAMDDVRRRASDRAKARAGAGMQAPGGSVEAAGVGTGFSQHAATGQPARTADVCAPGPLTEAGDHPIIFRPYRKPVLFFALVLLGMALLDLLVPGPRASIRIIGSVCIPGPLVVGACLVGAVFYLGLFIRSYLPGREIIVDTSGIVLPRRRRVTWDRITEVKLCNAGAIEFLCTVRIGLNGGHRVNIAWWQTGCEPRKLYEAIQACFEKYERRAQPDHDGRKEPDGPLHPPMGVHPK